MSNLRYALGYEVDGNLKILTENDSILFAKHSNGKSSINPDMNKVMYFDDKESAIKEAESQGHEVNGYQLMMYTCDENAPTYIDRNGEGYE
ncbi:hypothetical protein FQV37_2552 [Psychrobacter nivimaris]|uniref:Uncharacterized protein n=1 Tax=Psychrobacter nivimaris TaxID=281738 RepID=A0A6N7C3Y3_9GAMM|nr:hypothetical protein [Psychrobacter nivimaris]KAF0569527.1 hypothetical protein FQV37_2552 [Psychrobacter nivimaris]